MNYKYLTNCHTSEHEAMIVRDYIETPIETHGNHLDHITHICQYYNISAPLLSEMLSHFKILDTQTHCTQCGTMKQIHEPTYHYQQQNFHWICNDCHQFIHQPTYNNPLLTQNTPSQIYNQDNECPF